MGIPQGEDPIPPGSNWEWDERGCAGGKAAGGKLEDGAGLAVDDAGAKLDDAVLDKVDAVVTAPFGGVDVGDGQVDGRAG